jgi:hypothetical protein
MTAKTTPHRKPNLLALLALFVGAGVLATGLAQAAQPQDAFYPGHQGRGAAGGEKWWQSVWDLDLAGRLKEWRPKVTWQNDAEGINLARPFGKSGPTMQCSSSLPDSVQYSLRAGGDSHIGALGTDTDVFVFLQKRW